MADVARQIDVLTENITCENGMPAFLAYPSASGKYPTIILMHERYGLVKPGEQAYAILPPQQAAPPPTSPKKRSHHAWWEFWR